MSLSAATSTALSGLATAQTGLRATANNITNVNTEGYDRRVVEQQSRLLGGVGVGVEVAEIKRVVDDFLNAQPVVSPVGRVPLRGDGAGFRALGSSAWRA